MHVVTGSCYCLDNNVLSYVSPASPDIYECADGTDKCGAHTTCTEKTGSYSCDCDKGFKKNADRLSCSGRPVLACFLDSIYNKYLLA